MNKKRAMYRTWKRDKSEKDVTAVLERYGIPYILMPPKAGFDILVLTSPVQLWEVKTPEYKWSLTESEQRRKSYCLRNNIPYRVIESMEQAVEALDKKGN